MKTVKLSYSILSQWEKHRFEDAIASYLGKGFPATPYMELGKVKHQQWADYTQKYRKLHPELGGYDLYNPIVEQKYEKLLPFSEDIQILWRGVIDLEDDRGILVDYKCGKSKIGQYIDGWQLDSYKLLRPKAISGQYICFNPYTKAKEVGHKFLHESNAENALEKIITLGGELIDYLQTNRLLIDYKPMKERQI